MENDLKTLQAMLLMSETLFCSATHKEALVTEIKNLIESNLKIQQYLNPNKKS